MSKVNAAQRNRPLHKSSEKAADARAGLKGRPSAAAKNLSQKKVAKAEAAASKRSNRVARAAQEPEAHRNGNAFTVHQGNFTWTQTVIPGIKHSVEKSQEDNVFKPRDEALKKYMDAQNEEDTLNQFKSMLFLKSGTQNATNADFNISGTPGPTEVNLFKLEQPTTLATTQNLTLELDRFKQPVLMNRTEEHVPLLPPK